MNIDGHIVENHSLALGQVGWKYYNSIKKKAMEQEFSWSGLLLSLSIAFFIVLLSAYALNLVYTSLGQKRFSQNKIYHLEKTFEYNVSTYLDLEHINSERLRSIYAEMA